MILNLCNDTIISLILQNKPGEKNIIFFRRIRYSFLYVCFVLNFPIFIEFVMFIYIIFLYRIFISLLNITNRVSYKLEIKVI